MCSLPTSAGQSGGVNITGEVGNADEIVGRDKFVLQFQTFIQAIDAEITSKISETTDGVAEVLKAIKGGATHLQSADERLILDQVRHEAEQLYNAGRLDDASRAFMDALEREDASEQHRRKDHARRRVRLLEEAIAYDRKAKNADAAFIKLRLIAETLYPDDRKAQSHLLFGRAVDYQEQGKLNGDQVALLIAVTIFSELAKDTISVQRA